MEFVVLILLISALIWWVRRRRAGQQQAPGGRDRDPASPRPTLARPPAPPRRPTFTVRERDPARNLELGEREIPFAQAHQRGPLFQYGGPARRHTGVEHSGPYAVIDLETTGLSPQRGDRVIELAVARVDEHGRIEDEYATLINPDGADTGPVFIHGISNHAVRDAPRFHEVAGELLSRLEGAVVVAHNAPFEERFLLTEFARAGIRLPSLVPAVCTLWLAQHTISTPNHRLGTLCQHFEVPLVDKHAALGDVRAVAAILPRMLHALGQPLVYATAPGTGLAPGYVPGSATPRTRAVALRKGTDGWMTSLMARLPMTAAEATGSQALMYLDELANVLEDGRIVGEEAKRLAKIAGAAGMGASQVATLNHQFLEAMLQTALEDEHLATSEISDLKRAAAVLGEPTRFDDLVPTRPRSTGPIPFVKPPPSTGISNSTTRADRVQRAFLAVQQQRNGRSRAEIAADHGVGTDTVKELLRDGKFYQDPASDPPRLEIATAARRARERGMTRDQFRAEHALSTGKAIDAWRDAAYLSSEAKTAQPNEGAGMSAEIAPESLE